MLNKIKSHFKRDYKVKSYVMLSIIFVLGFLAGMLVKDLTTETPFEQIKRFRESGGPIRKLTMDLELSEEQKEKIKPILERYDKRIQEFIQSGALFFRSSTDSLKAELKPYLTKEQIKKLDEEFPIPIIGGGLTGRFEGDELTSRLEKVLGLTEKQIKEIRPILEKYDKPFHIHNQSGGEFVPPVPLSNERKIITFNPFFDSLKVELKPYLTKEQINKLDEAFMPPLPPNSGGMKEPAFEIHIE